MTDPEQSAHPSTHEPTAEMTAYSDEASPAVDPSPPSASLDSNKWPYHPHSVGLEGRLTPLAMGPGRRVGPLQWHPADSEAEAFDHGRLQVRSVSIRGHSHRFEGSVRQDAMAHSVFDGWAGLAVADGLGSEHLSHIGAALAARESTSESAVRALANCSGEVFAHQQLREKFEDLAKVTGFEGSLSEFRTTLTVAAVQTHGDESLIAVVAKIGDSEAWLFRDNELKPIFSESRADSDLASSSVTPLPDSVEADVAQVSLQAGDQMLLTSDGIGELLERDNPYRRALLDLLQHGVPTAAALLAVTDSPVRSYDDDRTLILLHAREVE